MFAGALLGGGCVAKSQLSPVDFVAPKVINAATQDAIAIGKLNMLVPKGKKIGQMRFFFGISGDILAGTPNETVYRAIFYEELKKAGYNASEEKSVFERTDLDQGRFIIGGEIKAQSTDIFAYIVRHRIETFYRINWKVYDKRTGKEIYTKETTGAAKVFKLSLSSEAMYEGYRVNFQRLLSQPDFVEALKD